ncbi:MAG: hypothetical protein QXI11_06135 [Thermoproteota archaeon]
MKLENFNKKMQSKLQTRVLHIWNTAGVGSIIAKWMDKLYGTSSRVIMRKQFDKFGFTIVGEAWSCNSKVFTIKASWISRKFDIIHVHAFDKIIPILKMMNPKKPVVLHYHGADIRNRWREREKYWSKADVVLVSTPDLLEGSMTNVVYIPNPVDTDLFYPRYCFTPNTAFHISYFSDDLAIKYAEKYGLKLTIHDREKAPIPYTQLPRILSKYEYYIDVKRDREGRLLRALSKTGLEALACMRKVIKWDGNILEGLPPEHKPENVVSKIWEIYRRLIDR